jgi:hypothetical protein
VAVTTRPSRSRGCRGRCPLLTWSAQRAAGAHRCGRAVRPARVCGRGRTHDPSATPSASPGDKLGASRLEVGRRAPTERTSRRVRKDRDHRPDVVRARGGSALPPDGVDECRVDPSPPAGGGRREGAARVVDVELDAVRVASSEKFAATTIGRPRSRQAGRAADAARSPASMTAGRHQDAPRARPEWWQAVLWSVRKCAGKIHHDGIAAVHRTC